MSEHLANVIDTVNRYLPEYGRGVILPAEMEATRTANCFGRLAVIGAGLIYEGAGLKSLGWLLSLSHGEEYKQQRYWLGHAFLTTVDSSGLTPQLIDGTSQAFTRDISRTNWRPPDSSHRPFVDFTVLHEVVEGEGGLGQHTPDTTASIGYARAWVLRSFFAQYDFIEGMRQYQKGHPKFNTAQPVQLSDYMAFYEDITKSLRAT